MNDAPVLPLKDSPEQTIEIMAVQAANKRFAKEKKGVLHALSKLVAGELSRSVNVFNEAHGTDMSLVELVDEVAVVDIIADSVVELIEESVKRFTMAEIQDFEDALDEQLREKKLASKTSEVTGLSKLLVSYFKL